MTKTFGKMDAKIGERCGNICEEYTCPGCYSTVNEDATECPECKAPIKTYTEEVTNYYCEIRDPDEDDR